METLPTKRLMRIKYIRDVLKFYIDKIRILILNFSKITYMKPKNISIKKLTEKEESLNDNTKKSRNSRKSVKIPQRELNDTRPSPITLMKKNTYNDEESSDTSNKDNFIECINGYLNKLDAGEKEEK